VDLLQSIQEATAEWHGRIERLPLALAIIEGRVTRDAYVALLGELLTVHRAVEYGLQSYPEASVLYRPDMARCPALVRDRTALGAEFPETGGTTAAALAAWLEECAQTGYTELMGALYILEGSRMGSLALARPLAHALEVPLTQGKGLDYHLEGMADRPRTWQTFKATLRTLPLTALQVTEFVNGAAVTMRGLHDLYASLPAGTLAAAG
jgi:heme oxygenase